MTVPLASDERDGECGQAEHGHHDATDLVSAQATTGESGRR